jgi:hypothetical protein
VPSFTSRKQPAASVEVVVVVDVLVLVVELVVLTDVEVEVVTDDEVEVDELVEVLLEVLEVLVDVVEVVELLVVVVVEVDVVGGLGQPATKSGFVLVPAILNCLPGPPVAGELVTRPPAAPPKATQ